MRLLLVLAISVVVIGTLGFFGYESIETNTINQLGLALALAGIGLAVLGPVVSDWLNEPDFEILNNESASNANPLGPKLLNVIVRNKRNLMSDTRAKVTLFLEDGKKLSTSGKWGSQPEPALQLPLNLMPPGSNANSAIFQGWLTTLLRSADIPHKDEDYLDFAVKHPNDPDFYLFDSWSYANGWKGDKKVTSMRKAKVLVEVKTGRVTKSKAFMIENPSSHTSDFELKEMKNLAVRA